MQKPARSVPGMGDTVAIRVSAEAAAAASSAAAWRGISLEQYVDRAVAHVARQDAELAAALKEAEDDIAAGRVHTQQEVEIMFGVERERRDAA